MGNSMGSSGKPTCQGPSTDSWDYNVHGLAIIKHTSSLFHLFKTGFLVSGCERFSNYTGYADSFTWTSDCVDTTPR